MYTYIYIYIHIYIYIYIYIYNPTARSFLILIVSPNNYLLGDVLKTLILKV